MKQIACIDIERIFLLDTFHPYSIVIESPSFFYSFVSKTIDQIERGGDEYLVLSENNILIDLKKKGIILTDLFHLEPDEKKTTSTLNKYLSTNYEFKEISDEINAASTAINIVLSKVKDIISIPVDYNDEFTLLDIAKFANLRVTCSTDSFLSYIVDFIKFNVALKGIEIFILLNTKRFLDEKQYTLFLKEMMLLNVEIINIETSRGPYHIENETEIVIDKDLCEYYPMYEPNQK